MGTSASHEKLFNWQQIQHNRYVNKTTNELIDYQQVPITSNADQVLTTYRNRLKIYKGHVVQLLYYCKVYGADGVCCEEKEMVDVYIEGGLQRLDVAKNNYKQKESTGAACYCVDILRGFEALRQLYGAFQVHADMVWLDTNKRIKVWVNRNPFLNDYISVRENLMVLQIKQILLKQDCRCNTVIEQDLSLNNFKLKIENIRQNTQVDLGAHRGIVSGRHEYKNKSYNANSVNTGLNTSTANVVKTNTAMKTNRNITSNFTSKNHDSKKNIFYYPSTTTTLPLQNNTTRLHQYETTTPKYNRTQKLSMTQKVYINKEPQKIYKNEKKVNISFNTVEDKQDRKNHSTIISINAKSSNSKILFNYDDQSSKGTPHKLVAQINGQKSQLSSPMQISHMKFREKVPNVTTQESKNKPEKKLPPSNQPHVFWQEKKPNEVQRSCNFSLQYHRPSFQSQKSEDIRTPPFQLSFQQQKFGKKSSGPDKNLSFNLEQVRERQSSELSRQKIEAMRKEINYQNSYTDRQINGSSKIENEKVRASVESEKIKIEGNYTEFEYEMPQKTKLLIEKYLLNKQPSQKIQTSQTILETRKVQTKRGFLLNRQFFTRNREKVIRISRQSIQQNINSETIDERISEEAFAVRPQQNSSESEDYLQMKRVTSAHSVNKMEKNEKQILKKQMQKIFNFSPHDEEQTKIRKKVAQKKAFFADLKKEASKILDNKEDQ